MIGTLLTKSVTLLSTAKAAVSAKALSFIASLDLGTYLNPDTCPEYIKSSRLGRQAIALLDYTSFLQSGVKALKVVIIAVGGGLAVLGVVKNKRQWRYFPKRYIDLNHKNLSKWKVLIGAASGAGIFGEALSTPIIIEPLQGYTQTYIGVGAFETRDEAANLEKYFHTKFLRTMLGILKITQHNEIGTWRMVPLQNFTASSDIDWSQSIAGIDRQLYAKYGLSDEEIAFIETHVKEME